MPFGGEFTEKLTHTMVATALCCGTAMAAVSPNVELLGLVEAVLGMAGVAHFLLRRRASSAEALLRRCAKQVNEGSDTLLATEYRSDPDATFQRDDAIAAIRDVLPHIMPRPEELVEARLKPERVVAFYLDRAATARPGVFTADTMASRLLHDVIARAWDCVLRQPEFRDEVAFGILRELLPLLDDLRQELSESKQVILIGVTSTGDDVVRRIVAELDARGVGHRAAEAGLERQAMLRLAGRLKPDEMLDFDQAVAEVEHAVDVALQVIARGERVGNLDAFVRDVLRSLVETTRVGEFDRGARAVDDALRDLDRREAEQRVATRRSRVALLEAGIEQDTLRRDAASVARRIEMLVAAEGAGGRAVWSPMFRQRWDALFEEGRDKGLNFSLEVAAAMGAQMLWTADNSDERGASGVLLGNALQMLGKLENDTARLERAVAAYRDALKEYTRQRTPQDWAMTQNNIGNALATLGEREKDTLRLEQAVSAYRAALEVYTHESVPMDWAMTQNNLGAVLQTLGAREPGTARLKESVAAYHAALDEHTRERAPLSWAMTQNNLGNALRTLGERESGTARLEDAAKAFSAALEERTRERLPLDWAMTQTNLGNALLRIGERQSDTLRLEQAVEAFHAALGERTRERVPRDWANTQNNLGNALLRLGEHKGDATRLEQAIEAYRAALLECTRERLPLDWASTQNNLGIAMQMLAMLETGTAWLEQAIKCYHTALEERTRERVPLEWAATQNNLGSALLALGDRESGTVRLEEAVAAYHAALEERTRDRVLPEWAFSQHGLGNALAILATRLRNPALMAEALSCMRSAAEVYHDGNITYWIPIASQWISEIEAALATMPHG